MAEIVSLPPEEPRYQLTISQSELKVLSLALGAVKRDGMTVPVRQHLNNIMKVVDDAYLKTKNVSSQSKE
jgi:hypothetical protein